MMVQDRKGIALSDLSEAVRPVEVKGDLQGRVGDVTCDSREVVNGTVFVALSGTREDGHRFVGDAAKRGAAAAIVEHAVKGVGSLPLIRVEDSMKALGIASAEVHRHPTREVPVLAETGTNGKTTVNHMVDWVLESLGRSCGIIGTISYRWKEKSLEANNTTPGADTIQRICRSMVDDGVDVIGLELSSHGIDRRRLSGSSLHALALTNVARDHLDYHGDWESYRAVKERLFFQENLDADGLDLKHAVLNIDDSVGKDLACRTPLPRTTFGFEEGADLQGTLMRSDAAGLHIHFEHAGEEAEVALPLVGTFNGSNALAATGLLLTLELELPEIAAALADLPPVPGRMERIERGQSFTVFVDFAHTPDGLEHVLRSIRSVVPGRVITLFGCGGDRDKGKRAEMARVVGRGSDLAILTDDNPRTEDPASIRADAVKGLDETGCDYEVIGDRAMAIERAIRAARPGDAVILAGKGHESFQIVGEEKIPFLDREVAEGVLDRLGDGER